MTLLSLRTLVPGLLALALNGCAVGPDFKPAPVSVPEDWSSWRSGGAAVVGPTGSPGSPSAQWWRVFGDATLDHLQQRALEASPDLQTAALRYAQVRVQRQTVAAQRGPDVGFGVSASRQRTSEYATNYRVLDQLAGGNRDALGKALGDPYTFYKAGFDASWELDLWGRVRRSVEAADADIDTSAALLDAARLSIASELARSYFELRTTQRLIGLTRDDIEALQTRLELVQVQVRHGLGSELDTEGQRTQLTGLRAQLPNLLEQEVLGINRIGLLLGARPGELRQMLVAPKTLGEMQPMPNYTLGLPSEMVRRRPDIRAAEARLHRATAEIGIAEASLYPSIRLGAHFGSESYYSGRFGEWGTRAWSIGPSLDLPIFDSGRRRSTLRLRELQQQEAAIAWQQTVLKAWLEVDDALSAYANEQQAQRQWQKKTDSSAQAYAWAQARHRGGLEDFSSELDAQRTWLQARREQVASAGRLRERFVAVHKAIGGGGVAEQ